MWIFTKPRKNSCNIVAVRYRHIIAGGIMSINPGI